MSDPQAERAVGPDPGGYLEASVPAVIPEAPRSPDRLASLKRETIKSLKEFGLIQTGRTPGYDWAFGAAEGLARRIGEPGKFAIDACDDEPLLCRVHNAAVEQLRKLREKEAAAGGAPFRRDPEGVATAV